MSTYQTLNDLAQQREALLNALSKVTDEMKAEIKTLRAGGAPKTTMSEVGRISRPTIDVWLKEN